MMILRESRGVGAGKGEHIFLEPIVVGLPQAFHRSSRFILPGVTPGRRAAAARLLRYRERDPLVECTGEERHLAGIGTTRDTDPLEIDLPRAEKAVEFVQAVDDSADTPRPGAVLSR